MESFRLEQEGFQFGLDELGEGGAVGLDGQKRQVFGLFQYGPERAVGGMLGQDDRSFHVFPEDGF